MNAKEFLENKGIDTEDIVSYSTPNGTGTPIDIDIISVMKEYVSQQEVVSKEEIGKAADDYAFQVPYDGTKDFYNKTKHKSFQDGIKWMQDKLYRSKKECWACFKKLPKGHKSGLCLDCQIRG